MVRCNKFRMFFFLFLPVLFFYSSGGYGLIQPSSPLMAIKPEPNQTYQLKVGESLVFFLPETSDIQVSRRGIIDIQYHDNAWLITAVQSGFVVIYEKKREDPHQASRFFLDVSPKNPSLTSEKQETIALPPWICSQKGVFCDHRRNIIKGTTDSFILFLHFKEYCHGSEFCFFELNLSPQGRENWKSWLKMAIGPGYDIDFTSFSSPAVRGYCHLRTKKDVQEQLNLLTADAFAKNHLVFFCKEESLTEIFQIRAKVFLLEKSRANEFGLSTTLNGEMRAVPSVLNYGIVAKLQNYLKKNRAAVLGEPSLVLNAGAEGQALSGGEFPTRHLVEDSNKTQIETWKKYGLDFRVTINPIKTNLVLVKYAFDLKNRGVSESAPGALKANTLAGLVTIGLNKPLILGSIDFSADDKKEETPSLLESIPILSPFFRLKFSESAQTNLYLWMIVKKVDGPREIPEDELHFKSFSQ